MPKSKVPEKASEFRPHKTSVGGGKDYFHNQCAAEDCVNEWSMRWQVDYTLKGAEHVDPRGCTVPDGQCTNDLQGPMVSLYLPSPANARPPRVLAHYAWDLHLPHYCDIHRPVPNLDTKGAEIGNGSAGLRDDVPLLSSFAERYSGGLKAED